MSSTYAASFDRLAECLDEIASIDPTYRTTAEMQELLVMSARARARLQAMEMTVLAVGDDIAEATGDRSTAAWLASKTRDAHGTLRANARLAVALDARWTLVQAAFVAGEVNLAQVRVIDKALTDLPKELGDDLIAKAEAFILGQAAKHGPRELATLGGRVLEYLAPDIAAEHEYQQLLAAERRADAGTRLALRARGDGSTDGHFRIPDHAAGRLRADLAAFTAPRRHQHHPEAGGRDEFAQLPLHRQHGIAFVALLERVLKSDLPRHGGKATTLAVLIDYDTLVADLTAAGIAQTTAGDKITADQARRLGCQAGILPAVLGANSEVLDLGRESRFFKPAQRTAMEIRDKTCTEVDCTMPAAFCEAHHPKPWAEGGETNLDDGRLLCPFHHRRAHDPGWNVGTTSFTRRQWEALAGSNRRVPEALTCRRAGGRERLFLGRHWSIGPSKS